MAQASESIERQVAELLEAGLQVSPQARILVAVSGGKDSMCLLHVLHRLGFALEVAHVNYQLRAAASDLDEALVKTFCSEKAIPCHVKHYETKAIASAAGQSIQACARELRYAWFAELLGQHKLQWVATAHHLQDSLETFMINLSRGTGLKGLLGIPAKREQIIRPLSKVKPADILAYVQRFAIPFREDASNFKTTYTRNKIRLELLPVLDELPGKSLSSFSQTQDILQQHFELSEALVAEMVKEHVEKKGTQFELHMSAAKSLPFAKLLLQQYLSRFNFSNADILAMQDCREGAVFASPDHEACYRLGKIIIQEKKTENSTQSIFINEQSGQLQLPEGKFSWEPIALRDDIFKNKDSHSAYLNLAALQWPLRLKKWEQGDRFSPLGLSGKSKLVSDYFADKKLNAFEKKAIWLLCSEAEVCWIVGQRMAEPFKLNRDDPQCLAIKWAPN